jgi:hypothetical protein
VGTNDSVGAREERSHAEHDHDLPHDLPTHTWTEGGIACKGSTSKDRRDPVGVGGVACGSGVCVYLCVSVGVCMCERACRFWACVHRSDVSVRDVT